MAAVTPGSAFKIVVATLKAYPVSREHLLVLETYERIDLFTWRKAVEALATAGIAKIATCAALPVARSDICILKLLYRIKSTAKFHVWGGKTYVAFLSMRKVGCAAIDAHQSPERIGLSCLCFGMSPQYTGGEHKWVARLRRRAIAE